MKPKIIFPIYRKYTNNLSFFKINSKIEFEEVKFIGSRSETHLFRAKILPDFNFIEDMISFKNNCWVLSNKDEFESAKLNT